jgi:Ca2+-transporting ATPase
VAREVGILDTEETDVLEAKDIECAQQDRIRRTLVFARVSPADKLTLVDAFQDAGEVVGMTGDGVNDAPALKKADIGIAMGRRGTDVAQEAGDIVLKDDAFETIVMAVQQGRTIFMNIRRFVVFLLSGNLGQITAISLAALAAIPLPLLPLQILFLNLVLDVFPALALGVGGDEPEVMRRRPRDRDAPILDRHHWLEIVAFGVAIGASVLGTFGYALFVAGMSEERAITVSFLTYAFARLWHLFNMRSSDSGLVQNNIVRNPFVWGAITVCLGLIFVALYQPALASLLALVPPSGSGWVLVAVGSLLPLAIGQIGIELRRTRPQESPA